MKRQVLSQLFIKVAEGAELLLTLNLMLKD